MGQACTKLCSKTKKTPLMPMDAPAEEKEVELNFVTYKSSMDEFYKKIEDNYNFLKYFQLYEFLLILSHLKVEGKKVDQSEIQIEAPQMQNNHNYFQEINKMEFLVFIENKIMKNYLVISLMNENEENSAIFKDFISEVFDAFIFATIDLFKKKNPGVKVKKGSIKSIKKLFIFVIPLLYCMCSNFGKVDLFFNLFANEGRFSKTEELKDFLFYLFIFPSTCGFRAIKQLGEKYPNKFDQISNEEYFKKSDAFEVSDIERLVDIFLESFFTSRDFLTKAEFESNFRNEDFGWIFNSCGIRSMLERHNDVKLDVNK